MPRYDFDMFTIGAGSGGRRASSRRARRLRRARVAICEELRVGRHLVLLRGCVPKKLLVYSAQFADAFADAEGFGWTVPTADFELAQADRRQGQGDRAAVADLHQHAEQREGGRSSTDAAWVVDPHTVEVNGKRYTADNILVAAGGWPETPQLPGIEHVISSNEAARPAHPCPNAIVIRRRRLYRGSSSPGNLQRLRQRGRRTRSGAPEVLRGFDEDIRVYLGEEMARARHRHPRQYARRAHRQERRRLIP